MTRSLAPIFFVLLLIAGCDSQESLLGEFEGRVAVTGETRDVTGEAVYTVVETVRGPEFVLGLFVGDLYESDFDEYDYLLFRRPGHRPGVGAYAIDDDPTFAVAATIAEVEEAGDPSEASGSILQGTGGTLAVTRVDDYGFVSGSFQFDATGISVRAPSRSVAGTASGRFEARYEPPSTFRRLGLNLGL